MTPTEVRFHEIASSIPDAKEGKMFGAICIKAPNGKAAVFFSREGQMVFKLPEQDLKAALDLEGAQIFAPGGRQMNGWVELPAQHEAIWEHFAERAFSYVKNIEK